MSLSNEDYFLEFEGNYEEPKIVSDDDDDDEDDESGMSMKYCLDDVDTVELLDYVDEIKEEATAGDRVNEELKHDMKKMKKTIKEQTDEISNLKKELAKTSSDLSSLKKEKDDQMKNMNAIIKEQAEKISSLESRLQSFGSNSQSFGRFFSVDMSKEGPGIIAQLKDRQKTPFDRLFVASQSSNDIYTLLVPNEENDFTTINDGNFYIEFELEKAVTINGVKVFSSDSYFPKSFDIAVEGKTVKSVKEARELNGEYKDMTVNFEPIHGRKIRFIQKGPNWDENTNFLYIKGIELLSSESRYSKGVFKTLVDESEDKDPHKCPVIISASYFDFNNFYRVDSKINTYTYDFENSWFQVELTRGTAILNGFRLKRCGKFRLKSYKLICTFFSSKPESSWTKLIEINEKSNDEHGLLDIYEFPHPSPPTRFVRLVQTGRGWNNDLQLRFFHFDLFGSYF